MITDKSPWRLPLLQGLLLFGLLLWSQWQAIAGMAAIWWRSDTFAHALLVPPVSAWLIWRCRDTLRAMAPVAWGPGLLGLAAAVALAGIGQLAEVNALQHFGAVLSLQALALTLYGPRVCWAIAFPLLFLLFAPPFGEFLVELMMLHTADFTVGALRLLGIPVFREGLHFVIPSGNWSVVEACSGLRYLFASFMVGTLFAYLNFQRWPGRLGFMLVSLLVPVVANWLRALIIVLLGHYSSNRIATGADHLVYGWVFFGIIMAIMFWIGARWADAVADKQVAAPAPPLAGPAASRSAWLIVVLAAALLCLPSLWLERLRAIAPAPLETGLLDPLRPQGNWQLRAADSDPPWTPVFVGASLHRQSRWSAPGAADILLDIAIYPAQREGAKAVSSVNTLVRSKDDRWASLGSERLAGEAGQQTRWVLRGRPDDRAMHLARRLYWVDGQFTASEREAKLLGLRQRLAGRGDLQAAIVWMTPDDGQGSERLDRFWRDIRTPLNERLQRAAQQAAGTMPAAAESSNVQTRTQ